MEHNDRQYGKPFCEYNDTKANIESITGLEEGCIAYATDTNELGTYDGASWQWGSGISNFVALATMEWMQL